MSTAISDLGIHNLICTNADTEYSVTIPRAAFLRLQARTADIRVALRPNFVATSTPPFMTIKAASPPREFSNLRGADITVYAASAVAGAVLELEGWV